jgi:hypothetical protein
MVNPQFTHPLTNRGDITEITIRFDAADTCCDLGPRPDVAEFSKPFGKLFCLADFDHA